MNIESKTKDNVFVTVPVAVQYRIREEQVVDAYYKLSNPEAQIRSYVFDTVRSALSLELDAAFESKDDIARSVETTLSPACRSSASTSSTPWSRTSPRISACATR